MTRKRDLTGFGGGTSPASSPNTPPVREIDPAPIVPTPRRSKQASRTPPAITSASQAATKQRITLSLPTRVATMLRSVAEAEQRIFLDIILTAFIAHADAVERDLLSNRAAAAVSGSRRRAGSGRTQIPLNILKEDLAVLDRRVQALNMDRSAYVTELLLRELKR